MIISKKITDQLVGDRRRLIDPTHARLRISQQCDLLGFARSNYYYQLPGESVDNLALMWRIDKLFTDRPELGVRRMQQELTVVIGVKIECPNHVWSTDTTYIPTANGFLYLCAIIDWYSRFVLNWSLSNTLLVDFCIDTLQDALGRWGKPHIFNSDQGSQFISPRFLDQLTNKELVV